MTTTTKQAMATISGSDQQRLRATARSAYQKSPYGHGHHDWHSAVHAVGEDLVTLGITDTDLAWDLASEITDEIVTEIEEVE